MNIERLLIPAFGRVQLLETQVCRLPRQIRFWMKTGHWYRLEDLMNQPILLIA